MRIIGRILCLFGKHQWKRYSRWNGVRCDDGEKVQQPRRVCIHCKKRETVPAPKDIHEAMAQAIKVVSVPEPITFVPEYDLAYEEYRRQEVSGATNMSFETWKSTRSGGWAKTISPYVPPEGVSNESGAPEMKTGG